MNTTTDNKGDRKKSASDEINFDPFFSAVRSFFSAIASGIRLFFSILLNKWKSLSLGVLLGCAVGMALYIYLPPVYRTEMILTSGDLDNSVYFEKIGKLKRVIKDKSPKLLTNILGISEQEARQVHDIGFFNADRLIDTDDSIPPNPFFRLMLEVNDPAILEHMQTALVKHLEDNEYSLIRKELKRKRIEAQIVNIQKNIGELDNLEKVISKSLIHETAHPGLIFGEPLDPIPAYKEEIELYEKELELGTALTLIDNVQVVSEFVPFEKPHSPKLSVCLLLGFGGGFFLAFIRELVLEKRL